MVSFFAEVKIFRFWPKTIDYSPWFDFRSSKKVVKRVYHLKGNEKRNLMVSRMALSSGELLAFEVVVF